MLRKQTDKHLQQLKRAVGPSKNSAKLGYLNPEEQLELNANPHEKTTLNPKNSNNIISLNN